MKKRIINYKSEKLVVIYTGNWAVYRRVKSLSAKAQKEVEKVCRNGLNGGEIGAVLVEEGAISVEADPSAVAEAPEVIENDSYFLSLVERVASGSAYCGVGYDIYAKERMRPPNGRHARK